MDKEKRGAPKISVESHEAESGLIHKYSTVEDGLTLLYAAVSQRKERAADDTSLMEFSHTLGASLAVAVLDCCVQLQQSGWFSKSAEFSIDADGKLKAENLFDNAPKKGSKQEGLQLRLRRQKAIFAKEFKGLAEEYRKILEAVFVDFQNFSRMIADGCIITNQAFSNDWYAAKILWEYSKLTRNEFLIGVLWDQLCQKQTNEETFSTGQKSQEQRKQGAKTTHLNSEKRKQKIVEIAMRLADELGIEFWMMRDDEKVEKIRAVALREARTLFQWGGKPNSNRYFLELYEDQKIEIRKAIEAKKA